ncbi:hypothetical protein NEF87_003408 [Candidatus Lokiarchaeum ossiferum]|uniref:Uncharacterized protein n=1 Tax=Candidatus Lokiarchaeum ossiferum TaxID=2951803 RepID=A0ABY6HUD3_9ARCH|nr:hypothetical protein NEF87_003408 [Candidatus Lokiarchaeum sp. B-35]
MIKCLQICDSLGFPFFNRIFGNFPEMDETLLAGLISAISSISNQIFHQKLATITFGEGKGKSNIVIVQKDFLQEKKSIYFVFFIQGECDMVLIKEVSTEIFIKLKNSFRNPTNIFNELKEKINFILDTRFHSLTVCL